MLKKIVITSCMLFLTACTYEYTEMSTQTNNVSQTYIEQSIDDINARINIAIAFLNRILTHEEMARFGIFSYGNNGTHLNISIDPYTYENKMAFELFLYENGFFEQFEPDIFSYQNGRTEEMENFRRNYIKKGLENESYIVLYGTPVVSRTGIEFTLQNTTDREFMYGAKFDLGVYIDGEFVPVQTLPGRESVAVVSIGFDLSPNRTFSIVNRRNFEWRFGTLQNGQYVLVLDGHFGPWPITTELLSSERKGFATIFFEIDDDTPNYLEEPAEGVSAW
ncbi:MAG: hypothetical protein FWF57_04130 [Defluviitaleaceae bacterium]|nr:hypothetical protein [Defluviitaleaceae bacterium]